MRKSAGSAGAGAEQHAVEDSRLCGLPCVLSISTYRPTALQPPSSPNQRSRSPKDKFAEQPDAARRTVALQQHQHVLLQLGTAQQ